MKNPVGTFWRFQYEDLGLEFLVVAKDRRWDAYYMLDTRHWSLHEGTLGFGSETMMIQLSKPLHGLRSAVPVEAL
jgi:hypothetical protein